MKRMKYFAIALVALARVASAQTGFDARTSGPITATYWQFRPTSTTPVVSQEGIKAILWVDSTCSCIMVSENGSAPVRLFQLIGGAGTVTSFNGRTGTVVPSSGDYGVGLVTGAAPLASPTFTGTPIVPTASPGTNTTQAASTAFVQAAATALAFAPLASPAFTGAPTVPTASGGTNTTQAASTAYVITALGNYSPLASPAFTGVPSAPTASPGTSSTQLATTAFVAAMGATLAPLASPGFTGVPTVPTAAGGTNTTQAASTAFVQTAVTGAVGSSVALATTGSPVNFSLAAPPSAGQMPIATDSTHATWQTYSDATKAPLASPTFTGVPAGPTAAVDTSTTQLATTAFVTGQASSTTPLAPGTAAVGSSLRYARADHVHPTDPTLAPLASPTFTGVPQVPTASPGTNTLQSASTGYVVNALGSYTPLASFTSTLAGYAALAGATFSGPVSINNSLTVTGTSTLANTTINATGSQPAPTSGGFNGTDAFNFLTVTGAQGGNTSTTTASRHAGAGGGMFVTTGAGGDYTGAGVASDFAGAPGGITLATGNGGSALAGTVSGGNGSVAIIQGGSGGSSVGGAGGIGSAVQITGGGGGVSSAAQPSGNGGGVGITTGYGGNNSTSGGTAGNGGSINLTVGGSGTAIGGATPGVNGSIYLGAFGLNPAVILLGQSGTPLTIDGTPITIAHAGTTTTVAGTLASTGLTSVAPSSSGATFSALSQLHVEKNGDAGIEIASPNANVSRLLFTSPANFGEALLRWDHTAGIFDIGTGSSSGGTMTLRTGDFIAAMTLDATGNAVITGTTKPTGGILGVTTNSNACAGCVGEVIQSSVASPGVTLTTGSISNVTSVSLTAGDWDCGGTIRYKFAGTTSYTALLGGISTTSVTFGAGVGDSFVYTVAASVPGNTFDQGWRIPTVRISLASTTTVYVVTQAAFTVSTLSAYGTESCRRMR